MTLIRLNMRKLKDEKTVAQQSLGSACASVQSYQSIWWPTKHPVKTDQTMVAQADLSLHFLTLVLIFCISLKGFQQDVDIHVQSTLVLSKSKGLSLILWDICTLTYQIFRIEEKINGTATFHKWICNLTPEVRDILKILWKRGEIAP